MTQKKKFVEPELEIILFDEKDVITSSGIEPVSGVTTFSAYDVFNLMDDED